MLKTFSSGTTEHNSQILHRNNPWVDVINVCSTVGTTCINGQIFAEAILTLRTKNLILDHSKIFSSKSTEQNFYNM